MAGEWAERLCVGASWAWRRKPAYYFVYHRNRASRIPQGILGLHFPGHLISDYYAGYNVIRGALFNAAGSTCCVTYLH